MRTAWVGSLDTLSHATKGKKCAKETWSLITLIIDFKNIEVHVTPWFTPLPQLSVINDPVPLDHFFPLVACLEGSSDPTHCCHRPSSKWETNQPTNHHFRNFTG